MIRAPLATPENDGPAPAAIPATWVPCSQPFTVHGSAAPDANEVSTPSGHTVLELNEFVEKHASAMTLPPAKKSWSFCTPVSRIATIWPVPS